MNYNTLLYILFIYKLHLQALKDDYIASDYSPFMCWNQICESL